jgi:hypothetical protein
MYGPESLELRALQGGQPQQEQVGWQQERRDPKPKQLPQKSNVACLHQNMQRLEDVKPVYLLNLYASAMDASLLTVAQTPSFTGYDKSTWYLLKDEMSRRGWKVWHPKFPEEKDRIWLPSCEFKRRMLIFRQYERKRFFEQSSGQVRYV